MDLIRSKVAEMAGLSERALKASLRALVERNRQLAYSVILRDQYIDERETELNQLCLEFLVRQQPVAGQLRFVFTAIQINKELERIGDYAESIVRQVLAVSALEPQPPYAGFTALGNLSIAMLRDAVRSFLEEDPDLAWRTMATEEQGNTMRSAINAELTDLSRKGQLPMAALNPLMTITRRFERVTDQAKNLCEEVLYLCTGEFTKHKGGDAFRILFFDSNNACLSQMAEGHRQFSGPASVCLQQRGGCTATAGCARGKVHGAEGHRPFPADQQIARTGAAMGAVPGGDCPQRTGSEGAAPSWPKDHLLHLADPGPGASRGPV